MKSMSFLLLILSLFLLIACDAQDEVDPRTQGYWSPVTCAKEIGAAGCTTEWNFYFKRDGFPKNVSIYINNVKLIDECSPNGRWITQTSGAKKEFRLDNFSSIKKTDKISMRVMNLGEPCGTLNREFIYHEKQDFEVSTDENDPYVVIEG